RVCGIKVFMGSSTGNLLVDDINVLNEIFSRSHILIAVHCEDEETVQNNIRIYRDKYGENLPVECHPLIRNSDACFKSSSLATELAQKYGTRLHLLHLSTSQETELLNNQVGVEDKRITAEVCIHHLWFDSGDYSRYGSLIKWNPAIKSGDDRNALFKALLDDRIDVIGSDHAPHLINEKKSSYFNSPSGGPLVQHALPAMLEFYHDGKISLEKIVNKMCHSPADLFRVDKRGYIREGYWADLVLIDPDNPWKVMKDNILYKCLWSPFENYTFRSAVHITFVNGIPVYKDGRFSSFSPGMRLMFNT
ncbi:MAG: amidohydrolase family protein, partial [Bacteroidetes bacterium]|nr:amidohydrolase family protein [Bacteroidota bacterium]